MDILSLSLSQIGRCSPTVLAHHKIRAALLAIGSNYQAEYYLAKVAQQLPALGEMQVSTPLQNPDFTATVEQPKPDYVNQCLLLSLHAPMSLSALQKVLKDFEAKCDRHRNDELDNRNDELDSSCKIEGGSAQALSERSGGYHSKRVTMDIDILMVQLGQDLISNSPDFTINSLSSQIVDAHGDSRVAFEDQAALNQDVLSQSAFQQKTFKLTAFKQTIANQSTSERSIPTENEWLIMTDRYPFKAHEMLGIKELLLRR